MNKEDSIEPTDDQAEIVEVFSALRQIKSPPKARAIYRASMESELSIAQDAGLSTLPWWKRSVPVPIPVVVVASILLLFCAGTVLESRPNDSNTATAVKQPSPLKNPRDKVLTTEKESVPTGPTETQELAVSISTTYLCGVGPLSTKTHYVIKESDL